jgi:protein-disulfide isomerase
VLKPSRALEAASAPGAFWEMYDWFYEHQHELEGLDLERHAARLGVDVGRWKQDMLRPAARDRIREDVETGIASGADGTPTFFINGERYEGPCEFEPMLAALESARD